MSAPVLLVFWTRDEHLLEVCESIKEAKPSKLLLVQDGPRREEDIQDIKRCRDIVESVDWECEVFRNYSDKNMGAHTRVFTGISWAFEQVDELIYLEDDMLPTKSFYKFCTEMLEKFRDDDRFSGVCGGQKLGVYPNYPYDAIYSGIAFTGFGWGTWKRVWKEIEELYYTNWNEDVYLINTLSRNLIGDPAHGLNKRNIKHAITLDIDGFKETEKIHSWHTAVWLNNCFENRISVMATKNYSKYLGVSEKATYSGSDLRYLPKKVREVFTREAYDDLNGDISLPPFVIRNKEFDKYYRKKTRGNPHLLHFESILRRIIYGDFGGLKRSFIRKIEKRRGNNR